MFEAFKEITHKNKGMCGCYQNIFVKYFDPKLQWLTQCMCFVVADMTSCIIYGCFALTSIFYLFQHLIKGFESIY